jgi:hypothetical protein
VKSREEIVKDLSRVLDDACSDRGDQIAAVADYIETALTHATETIDREDIREGLIKFIGCPGSPELLDELTTPVVVDPRRQAKTQASKIPTAGKSQPVSLFDGPTETFRWSKAAKPAPPVELTFEQARVHAVLDEARASGNQERYHAAIEEVDRVDPGYYLGRVQPLERRKKLVLPFADPLAICRQMLETA